MKTFVGGRAKNRHADKRDGIRGPTGLGKAIIAGAVRREGNVVARVIANVRSSTLEAFVNEAVSHKISLLRTDQWVGYHGLGKTYPHATIDHPQRMYVVGAVHTKRLKAFGASSSAASSVHSTMSAKGILHLYVAEIQFYHNNPFNDDIFGTAISGC